MLPIPSTKTQSCQLPHRILDVILDSGCEFFNDLWKKILKSCWVHLHKFQVKSKKKHEGMVSWRDSRSQKFQWKFQWRKLVRKGITDYGSLSLTMLFKSRIQWENFLSISLNFRCRNHAESPISRSSLTCILSRICICSVPTNLHATLRSQNVLYQQFHSQLHYERNIHKSIIYV